VVIALAIFRAGIDKIVSDLQGSQSLGGQRRHRERWQRAIENAAAFDHGWWLVAQLLRQVYAAAIANDQLRLSYWGFGGLVLTVIFTAWTAHAASRATSSAADSVKISDRTRIEVQSTARRVNSAPMWMSLAKYVLKIPMEMDSARL
jgi:hypothetical protein